MEGSEWKDPEWKPKFGSRPTICGPLLKKYPLQKILELKKLSFYSLKKYQTKVKQSEKF